MPISRWLQLPVPRATAPSPLPPSMKPDSGRIFNSVVQRVFTLLYNGDTIVQREGGGC